MFKKIAHLILAAALICMSYAPIAIAGQEISAIDFEQLMQTVADGWNTNNAQKAADCFADNAIYSEPPDKQLYIGKNAIFNFFGGNEGRPEAMKMLWHHLAFSSEGQIGFGEYTFRYKDYQTHGITVVQISSGKISHWREYQYPSDLKWDQFTGENLF